jgi:hypothetical protein
MARTVGFSAKSQKAGRLCLGKSGSGGGFASQRGQDRGGEEVEGDGAGDGVAGEREEWNRRLPCPGIQGSGQLSESQRFAGLNGQAAKEEGGARVDKRPVDEVESPGGDAARDEEHCDVQRGVYNRLNGRIKQFLPVLNGGEKDGFCAGGRDHRGQHGAVGVADLVGARGVLNGNQFIAGGQDRHAGPGMDGDLRVAALGGEGDVGRGEADPGGNERIAGVSLSAARDDVVSRLQGTRRLQANGLANLGGSLTILGVFDHEHGIGTLGDGGAGHDLPYFSGRELAGYRLPGANLAGKCEELVRLGGADGESVAGGAWEGGLVAIGVDWLRQDAAGRGGESYGFRRDGFARGGFPAVAKSLDRELDLFSSFGVGEQRHSCDCSWEVG